MTEMPKLNEEEWPELRKVKAARNTGWEYFANLVKTAHQELGEEKTCQLLSRFMADNAKKYAQTSMKRFGIAGNDPWALASYLKLSTGDIIGYKIELIKESPTRVLYRLYPPCIWFPNLDIPPSFCLRGFNNFEHAAAEIINPKIKITCNKLMTAGDPYCELALEEVEKEQPIKLSMMNVLEKFDTKLRRS